MQCRPTPIRATGLLETMNDVAPDGFEIRRAGPESYVVITHEALNPTAKERVKEHFLDGTKIRFSVGELV